MIHNYIDAWRIGSYMIEKGQIHDKDIKALAGVLINNIMEHDSPENAARYIVENLVQKVKAWNDRYLAGYKVEQSSMMADRYSILLNYIGSGLGEMSFEVDLRIKEYILSQSPELQQKHIEAPQQPIGGNSGELAGNGNENAPEGEIMPPTKNYIELPPELQTTDKTAEKVFTEAYNEEWITERNDGGYQWVGFWEKSRTRKLAYMCANIYDTPPWKDIESFFGESQLGRDWGNVKNQIKDGGTGRQAWMNRIDNLINTALQ